MCKVMVGFDFGNGQEVSADTYGQITETLKNKIIHLVVINQSNN
jgi:hypothetical protein